LRQQGFTLLRSAHSRDCELEADEFGLRLMKAAGFSTGGAIALMQRLEQLRVPPSQLGQYFASHPPASERIARLRALERRLAAGK